MRVLVIGSGGREHALCRALADSSSCTHVFAAPGNPGTAAVGTNLSLDPADHSAVARSVQEHDIDYTIIGPEKPLVDGIADHLRAHDHPVMGPSADAARLEGSKAFAKSFMQEHGIPTASFRTFEANEAEAAHDYIRTQPVPVVVKASGLAGGKGALVCTTREEAHEALDRIVDDRDFGAAGDRVVIEAFMEGDEASVFVLTDGDRYVVCPPSQDHKAIGEGGTGPNTGGMGAYAPTPLVDGATLTAVCRTVVEPTLKGLSDAGTPYQGILYVGLMLTDDGPKVVEYNCRWGDPEAQVVLPLLENDHAALFDAVARNALTGVQVRASAEACVGVVLASQGYPHDYDTGVLIEGVDLAEQMEGVHVIHAGTRLTEDGTLVTDGGRVLCVVATAPTLETAIERAYEGADAIQFDGKTLRRDIARSGLMAT
ncbi:MAG: phosphoribosylamine--glycine ligase [Longimonas sp.]|uniref:phosphoribosylamine--glycine ligase n=1 Tax=Longimonas sp. TaxID=2039626 RepID=UPI00334F9942